MIEPVAECSLMLRFPSTYTSGWVAQLSHVLLQQLHPFLTNATPAYQQILIEYLPFRITEQALINKIETIVQCEQDLQQTAFQPKLFELPVWYSPQTALDLPRFEAKGLSLTDIIKRHSQRTYQISAIGFAPGFAFLSGLDEALFMPRLATPRTRVPQGSVAIADDKTAVYPSESPAGWNIIGRCPSPLFDPEAMPPVPFRIGDEITFVPIDEAEYFAQKSVYDATNSQAKR
ncbi:5-oxoprolinase subunit B family protein [Vibrio agarilyticus]|nr:allophanate hydrolase subunit 1 [Vibrio agarilyticus]